MKTLVNHIILGIHVTDRAKRAKAVQHLLTDYGCFIKTRIGLHDAVPDFGSSNGLIIVEMLDNKAKKDELKKKLQAIAGIEVKEMIFRHS